MRETAPLVPTMRAGGVRILAPSVVYVPTGNVSVQVPIARAFALTDAPSGPPTDEPCRPVAGAEARNVAARCLHAGRRDHREQAHGHKEHLRPTHRSVTSG